jgi:hypothetical protein
LAAACLGTVRDRGTPDAARRSFLANPIVTTVSAPHPTTMVGRQAVTYTARVGPRLLTEW